MFNDPQTQKARFTREISRILLDHLERYPLMEAEDAVKLVFQGMLGVGHLIASEETALERLQQEMRSLTPDSGGILLEPVSPEWFRLNLRPALALGLGEGDIARMLFQSAAKKPLPFTRQDVFRFCAELNGLGGMRAAAERVLDESWLPSHSERYRQAYRPAYRVLHRDFLNSRSLKGLRP